MIKADLHQLADPARALSNYLDIMKESEYIYGVNPREFAQANRKFMNLLYHTIFDNYLQTGDEFWKKIKCGILLTYDISDSIIGTYEKLEDVNK